MDEETTRPEGEKARCLLTLRLEQLGGVAPGVRGSGRRIGRCLSELEMTALSERLRLAATKFLREVAALDEEADEGGVDAQPDGSWALKLPESG
jgi:hypothetical protein